MVKASRHPRAHDYRNLIRRWRSVARTAGLRMVKFVETDGYDLFYLEFPVRRRKADVPAIYLSAGIHGDEPASTEGLIAWAEKYSSRLEGLNLLIFPCLNPWGLVNNSRYDQQAHDLNRCYHDDAIPFVAAHKRALTGRRFDLALLLHEDYDATGAYIYEVRDAAPGWGAQLLAAAGRFVPIEGRTKIEGRSVRRGLLWRRIRPDLMPAWPEAFQLYFHHAKRVFTVETPSEFHIDQRVAAQMAMLNRAVELCCGEFALRATPNRAS